MNCTLLEYTFPFQASILPVLDFSNSIERSCFVAIPAFAVFPLALLVVNVRAYTKMVDVYFVFSLALCVIVSYLTYCWFELLRCESYSEVDHVRFAGTIGLGLIAAALSILARFRWNGAALLGCAVITAGVIVVDYYHVDHIAPQLTSEGQHMGSRILYLVQLYLCCISLAVALMKSTLPSAIDGESRGWRDFIDTVGRDPTARHPSDGTVSYDVRFINLN